MVRVEDSQAKSATSAFPVYTQIVKKFLVISCVVLSLFRPIRSDEDRARMAVPFDVLAKGETLDFEIPRYSVIKKEKDWEEV